MRAVSVLVILSGCGLVLLICQAVRQEWNLKIHTNVLTEISSGIREREQAIVQINENIRNTNGELSPIAKKKDEMIKKKQQSNAAIVELNKSLWTCKAEMAEVEKKKTGAAEALQKAKDDQEAEKKKAQEEIQGLKQNILDRDKEVCKFVDQTMEEGRKLCGIAEAPNEAPNEAPKEAPK